MAEKSDSGQTFEYFQKDEEEKLRKKFSLFNDGVVKVKPEEFIVPSSYSKLNKSIQNFEVRPTDIFMLGFLKSGTTWMQEVAWNLVNNRNLDNPQVNIPIDKRILHLDGDLFLNDFKMAELEAEKSSTFKMFQKLCPGKSLSDGLCLQLLPHMPSPRMIKCHLPISLLPAKTVETSKVIYMIRDARDVIISYYYYSQHKNLMSYEGELNEFVDDFVNDRVPFGPYWRHIWSAWEKRDNPNVCLVFYENMKADPIREIKRLDKFLGTNATDSQIESIVHFTSFGQMKERFNANIEAWTKDSKANDLRGTGQFFRKGEAGGWKNELTPEVQEQINSWIEKNISCFGDSFKYKM